MKKSASIRSSVLAVLIAGTVTANAFADCKAGEELVEGKCREIRKTGYRIDGNAVSSNSSNGYEIGATRYSSIRAIGSNNEPNPACSQAGAENEAKCAAEPSVIRPYTIAETPYSLSLNAGRAGSGAASRTTFGGSARVDGIGGGGAVGKKIRAAQVLELNFQRDANTEHGEIMLLGLNLANMNRTVYLEPSAGFGYLDALTRGADGKITHLGEGDQLIVRVNAGIRTKSNTQFDGSYTKAMNDGTFSRLSGSVAVPIHSRVSLTSAAVVDRIGSKPLPAGVPGKYTTWKAGVQVHLGK